MSGMTPRQILAFDDALAETGRVRAELAAERIAHAETRAKMLEARSLAVTAIEVVDHAAAGRQALKWLTREPRPKADSEGGGT